MSVIKNWTEMKKREEIEQHRVRWNLAGSIFFAITVVTTIGQFIQHISVSKYAGEFRRKLSTKKKLARLCNSECEIYNHIQKSNRPAIDTLYAQIPNACNNRVAILSPEIIGAIGDFGHFRLSEQHTDGCV